LHPCGCCQFAAVASFAYIPALQLASDPNLLTNKVCTVYNLPVKAVVVLQLFCGVAHIPALQLASDPNLLTKQVRCGRSYL
jgi:hypothetical protein